jgi:O-antigen/teichoic acid export membrane protein
VKESIHRRLSINAIANLIRYGVYLTVSFLLTPFLVSRLGAKNYGLWVLVLSMLGYGGLLELGIQTAVVKLVAQLRAPEKEHDLRRLIATAFAYFQGAGILVALALWFVAPHFLAHTVKESGNQEIVRHLLWILGVDVLVSFPGFVFTGVMFGYQNYHLKTAVDVISTAANAASLFLLLGNGHGLLTVAAVKTTLDSLATIAFLILCLRLSPAMTLNVRLVTRQSMRELFTFGGKIFVSTTTSRMATSSEPVIVSYVLSNEWTTAFSIAKRLVGYIKEISWAATTGFMPMFSELESRNDLATIRDIYTNYTRYVLLLTLPLICGAYVLSVPFIALWVGPEFARMGGTLAKCFALACLIESLQPLIWRIMIGVGRVGIMVAISAVGSLIYVLASAILVYFIGLNGMGMAAIVIAVGTQVYFALLLCRYLEIHVRHHLFSCHLMPLIALALFWMEILAFRHLWGVGSYLSLILTAICPIPGYFVFAWFACLRSNERSAFIKTVRRLLGGKQSVCASGSVPE